MSKKAMAVSHGFHPPWNMGEAVLARNFAKVLMKIYDELSIISTIDERRGFSHEFCKSEQFNVKFYSSKEELRAVLSNKSSSESKIAVHFLNSSLIGFLNVARKARRIYLYQFAYNIYNNPSLIVRSIGALPLTYLGNIRIVTTALSSYRRFHRFFARHCYYIPAPIDPPNHVEVPMNRSNDELKILYLGHGSYLRFPYDRTLKALLRLKKEGYRVELNAYISELGYVDYLSFVKNFERRVEKSGLESLVKLHLKNLSETEKWKIIGENDVLLFPPLINVAIDPPLVILEAMFMGKCVLATPVQSVPYLLGCGRGVIVNGQSLEHDIYEALKLLIDNRGLLREYGMRAKEWVSKAHSMDIVQNKMREILNES